jgi:putative ABC transport system ATP-binding protein
VDTIVLLRDVTKTYQMGKTTVEALRGVDLDLEPKHFYAIVGPSGSGKSSLLHIIGCMDVPTRGEVVVNGKQLAGLRERQLTQVRAKEIGFVFQAFHLNPILTALENVAIALRFLGEKKRVAEEKASHWLARVGLDDRLHHHPAELSGGERQRVAIARAVVKTPVLILADEPTGNLDTVTGKEIIALLRHINQQEGTTVVMVTHDIEAAEMSDTIVTLRDGAVVSQGRANTACTRLG